MRNKQKNTKNLKTKLKLKGKKHITLIITAYKNKLNLTYIQNRKRNDRIKMKCIILIIIVSVCN